MANEKSEKDIPASEATKQRETAQVMSGLAKEVDEIRGVDYVTPDPPPAPAQPEARVTFEGLGERVWRAKRRSDGKHVGTVATQDGVGGVSLLPVVHEFISLAELKEIVAFMEKEGK